MICNQISVLTDRKDESYNSFILRLNEISRKNNLDITEIDHTDPQSGSYKDYITLHGIIVIFSSNKEWIDETVKIIRKSSQTAITPILVMSDTYVDADNKCDSVIKISSIDRILESEIEKNFNIVNEINTFTYVTEGSDTIREKLLILLRFLVSRNIKILEPGKSKVYPFYYNYPLANLLLDVNPGEEIEKLELLNKTKLLNGVIADKIFLCPYCQSTNVRLNECCPKCYSIDMQIVDSILHKKCGLLALEEDFINEKTDILKCPKCNIEFSYNENECEKFEANLCNACGNISKKPDYSFSCLNCSKNMVRNQLTFKEINKYFITADGVKAAESGILYNFSKRESVFKSENNPLRKEIFKEILYLENIRSIRFDNVFCLVEVKARGLNISEFALKELSKILSGNLRLTDVYIQLEKGIYLILFLNCGINEANSALKKIGSEIKSNLKDQVKIEWEVVSKSGERSSSTLFGTTGFPTSTTGMVLKNDILKEKPPGLKKAFKNLEIERFILNALSLKSVFKFFFFLYFIIFIFGVIIYTLIYYSGKQFGFISEGFQISLFIYRMLDKNGLIFLSYFNNPIYSTILACVIGLLFSVISGFSGFIIACIFNLCLKISKGMELRSFKNKPKA